MPLHEWCDRAGWDGVHHLWITELLRWIKPRLPEGYRAYIGVAPTLAVGAPPERPDVGVRRCEEHAQAAGPSAPTDASGADVAEPDEEIAVATLDPGTAVFVERHGRLVAGVELISPRNKDRPVARTTYLGRYLSYLLEGAHLMLVDVHRRPSGFSFGDAIARELQIAQPALPPPYAVSYRVGEAAASGGRILGIWRRPLIVEHVLPVLPLPVTLEIKIPIDLEVTYAQAASDAYLP